MSEQPSPKYSCHQTSISTLQISQKDMDSGPSPATSPEDRNPGFPCLHRRHRAQHARGSPRDTAGHPQTPCLHIRHGGLGARYPLGWADSEPPLGAMEGPQQGRQPCWPSTAPGAVRPLQPSRLLSRAEGLREPGLGRRKVLLPGAAAARSRRGGATSPSPPPLQPFHVAAAQVPAGGNRTGPTGIVSIMDIGVKSCQTRTLHLRDGVNLPKEGAEPNPAGGPSTRY